MVECVAPEDWPKSSIHDLAHWKNGLAFRNIHFSEAGRPIIKIAELKAGVTSQTARTMADYGPFVSVRHGDLLFSWSGNPDTSIDVFRWEGEDGWLNQHIFKVTPCDGVSGDFLFFLLKWLKPKFAEIARNKQTTGLGHVTKQDLRQTFVGVPGIREQAEIVGVVGQVQHKIDLNRRMNETLEAMARAIFKDWFVDFGPTRAKAEGRAPYLAPELWDLFPDVLDNEGKPVGWELRPVSMFAKIKGGKQLSKDSFSESGSVPVFGGAGLMGHTWNHNADGYVISVGRVGAYCGQFFSHRGPTWINNNASLISPFESVSGEWLLIALRALNIDLIKKGAAQPFVSNSDVSAMNVVYPGKVVLEAFHNQIVDLVLRQEANQREDVTLAQTRDLLLPKLMSGQIRLRDAEKVVEAVA